MARSLAFLPTGSAPSARAVLELFKPITWFPPMWAFFCGVVSSGVDLGARWPLALAGVILAGPLMCAMSQAVNDWFDRHVDAINEPQRPIPSGRIPGSWGLWIAIGWSGVSLAWAALLGIWVFGAALIGLVLAWAYSAPPIRLKQSGWLGPAACGLAYEGVTWFTGAAAMLQAAPRGEIVLLALLYSAGAFGIMTLNDFKAIEGDRATGVRSLPVQFGVGRAAWMACAAMIVPQGAVIAILLDWGRPWHALAVGTALGLQGLAMRRLLQDPARHAPWFNGAAVLPFVIGMLISAFAVSDLARL
jgi:chlorophyll synthase